MNPDVGILLIRVVVGLTLSAHGFNKFFGGGRIPGTARWFDSMGMKPNGKIHAILAATTEVGAGLFFAAGLVTPLAAAGFVALMTVAAWTVHRKNGFFIVKDGWEYNLVLATVAVGIAILPPDKYSIDHKMGWSHLATVNNRLIVSLGFGLIAGLGLLVLCYQPSKPNRPAAANAAPAPSEPDDEDVAGDGDADGDAAESEPAAVPAADPADDETTS